MLKRLRTGRWVVLVVSMALSMLACASPQIVLFPPTPTPTATPGLAPDLLTPQATIAITPVATLQRPGQQPTPTIAATATPSFSYLTGDVRLYPGPLHYSGDLLSVEVIVRNTDRLRSPIKATITVDSQPSPLDAEPFLDQSPLRDNVLAFRWAWDTTGLSSGIHELTVTLPAADGRDPQKFSTYVNLLPAGKRPPQEILARWDVRNTACCSLRFVTYTSAERDILSLAERANKAVLSVEQKMGFPVSNKPIPLSFIDIVWGNGAYTSDEIVMSYVDRDFVANDFDTILRHEITHWALRSYGTQEPLLLAEGAAVYVSDGHYKPEPLPERAQAVLDMNLYIPLADLTDHFRDHQHEIAYIEAGSFVQYLSETYGWGKFLSLYGTEHLEVSGSQWLDQALRLQYQKGLNQIERDYKAWLEDYTAGTQADDVHLTIALYDTIRRYQDQYSTYQESLPAAKDAVDIGQTAEFMRESTAPENIALETAFETAGNQLYSGQYADLEATLAAIDAALKEGDFTKTPVGDYLAIAKTLDVAGYEGQEIDLEGDIATVQVIRNWPRLEILTLVRGSRGWQIQPPR